MRCPFSDELWQIESETREPWLADHLRTCPTCRVEAERVAQVRGAVAALPLLDPPSALRSHFSTLQDAARDTRFTCDDTLALLDAWQDGEVTPAQTFLVEDHLLWCTACATVFTQAEAVSGVLAGLPMLEAPAAITEQIARARVPWWQRLLAPAPTWGRVALAGAALAGFMLLAVLWKPTHPPTIASNTGRTKISTPDPTAGNTDNTLTGIIKNIIRKPAVGIIEVAKPDAPSVKPRQPEIRIIGEKGKVVDRDGGAKDPDKPRDTRPEYIIVRGHDMVATYVPPTDPYGDSMATPTYPASEPRQPVDDVVPDYSAREAMLRMSRDNELANTETALATVNEAPVVAARPRLADPPVLDAKITPPREPEMTAAEKRKAINSSLRAQLPRSPGTASPIKVIGNAESETRNQGDLVRVVLTK